MKLAKMHVVSVRFRMTLALVFVSMLALGGAGAEAPDVTVTVTGEGPTIGEAKQDAIRQALQMTMKQLVVVDRIVSGDRVLLDKVLSTMNGYVERYVEKSVDRTSSGFRVTAVITISSSRIENFVGIPVLTGGNIEGESLFNEVNRRNAQITAERLQRKARGEILDRLLRGFPSSTAQLKLIDINIDDKDPSILNATLEYSYTPEFVKAMRGTLAALSWFECPNVIVRHSWASNAGSEGYDTMYTAINLLSTKVQAQGSNCAGPRINEILAGKVERNQFDTSLSLSDLVCLDMPGHAECYGLLPGDYCVNCRPIFSEWGGAAALVFGRFIDAAGTSANIGGDCISAEEYSAGQADRWEGTGSLKYRFIIVKRNRNGFTGHPQSGPDFLVAAFDFRPYRFMIKIPTSRVDLRRAKSLVAVAGFEMGTPGTFSYKLGDWKPQPFPWLKWYTEFNPENPNQQQVTCGLLDRAVRYATLERR